MRNNSNILSNNFKQILDRRSTTTLRSGPLLTGADKKYFKHQNRIDGGSILNLDNE